MTTVVPALGAILDDVLEGYPMSPDGLSRQAYGRFHAAQMKTGWSRGHQRLLALVDGTDLLASAARHELEAVLDGRPVRVCGIGAVLTAPARRGQGHADVLIERLLEQAARDGATLALLFSKTGDEPPHGFEVVPTSEMSIGVAETLRPGAPMTLIRSGEARDLAAIVAMGRVRAGPFRFHLDRDVDLIEHAITRRRLLAGLGSPDARQLHFFIAEEGITAAAYVVVSVAGQSWTLEECGDRDPSGARVGALLQALIAREPAESRPAIRAWLPAHFAPPQITTTAAGTPTEVLMMRVLGSMARPQLSGDDVLFWRSDIF